MTIRTNMHDLGTMRKTRQRNPGVVTAHGAIHRHTFPEGTKDKKLRIDLLHDVTNHKDEETFFSFIDDHTLGGFKHSNGWAPNQRVYFHMTSSHAMKFQKDRKCAKKTVDIEFKGKKCGGITRRSWINLGECSRAKRAI